MGPLAPKTSDRLELDFKNDILYQILLYISLFLKRVGYGFLFYFIFKPVSAQV